MAVILISKIIKEKELPMKENQNTLIYNSLEEFIEDMEKAPLDITSLITTSDVFAENIKEKSKLYAEGILQDKFLKIEELIHLVSTMESKEVPFLEFLNLGINIKEIIINQESLVALIQNRLDIESKTIKPFTMYRMGKEDYLEYRSHLDDAKVTQVVKESELYDKVLVEDLPKKHYKMEEGAKGTRLFNLLYTNSTVNDCVRFATIFAESLKSKGSVALIEHDRGFKHLSYVLNRSNNQHLSFDIKEFLKDPYDFMPSIIENEGIMLFTFKEDVKLDKVYYTEAVKQLIKNNVDNIVSLSHVNEPYIGKPILVLNTNLVDTLKSVREMSTDYEDFTIVAVDSSSIIEETILDDLDYVGLINGLLHTNKEINIFKIDSLKGGEKINGLLGFVKY